MDRFTRWTLLAVAALVIVATWIASRTPTASPGRDDADPASVTRDWFAALANGRPEDAWELLAPEAQAHESRIEFLRRHPVVSTDRPAAARIRIEAATVTGDEARVEVARSYGSSADFPFWRSTVTTDRVIVRLRLITGRWRVTVAPESP
jgi:hypothetical protein